MSLRRAGPALLPSLRALGLELFGRSRPREDRRLTVVMTFLNEGDEPRRTVESMYRTASPDRFNVVAVDDASDGCPDTLEDFGNVLYVRNPARLGSPAARQLGVSLARTPYVLLIDGHMRFRRDGWCDHIVAALEKEPDTAFCTTCLGLSAGRMDLQKARGRYCAATLSLLSDPDPARPARNVLEAKWAPRRLARVYEVPCILGASYGFSTAWFHRIRGLEGLRGWGTQEPFLSLKTWLAGGRCKILAHLEIGHKFRDRAPYRTSVADLYYNKLFVCGTVLPEAVADRLVARLPPGPALDAARRAIESAAELVREHRRYYESIFTRPFDEYCRRFGIRVPEA